MPFIKISTLPNSLDKAAIMKAVESDLYTYDEGKLMPENMATCIWQTSDCIVHKKEQHTKFHQTQEEVPVFVDLYVNTQFSADQVATIMKVVANALSKGTGVDLRWIFIHTHVGEPGRVFINGKVFDGKI